MQFPDNLSDEAFDRGMARIDEILELNPELKELYLSGDEKVTDRLLSYALDNAAVSDFKVDNSGTVWENLDLLNDIQDYTQGIAVPRVVSPEPEVDLFDDDSDELETNTQDINKTEDPDITAHISFLTEQFVHNEFAPSCAISSLSSIPDLYNYISSYKASVDDTLVSDNIDLLSLQSIINLDNISLLCCQEHLYLSNWGAPFEKLHSGIGLSSLDEGIFEPPVTAAPEGVILGDTSDEDVEAMEQITSGDLLALLQTSHVSNTDPWSDTEDEEMYEEDFDDEEAELRALRDEESPLMFEPDDESSEDTEDIGESLLMFEADDESSEDTEEPSEDAKKSLEEVLLDSSEDDELDEVESSDGVLLTAMLEEDAEEEEEDVDSVELMFDTDDEEPEDETPDGLMFDTDDEEPEEEQEDEALLFESDDESEGEQEDEAPLFESDDDESENEELMLEPDDEPEEAAIVFDEDDEDEPDEVNMEQAGDELDALFGRSTSEMCDNDFDDLYDALEDTVAGVEDTALSTNPLNVTDFGVPVTPQVRRKPQDKNEAAAEVILSIYNKIAVAPSFMKRVLNNMFSSEGETEE